MTSTRALHLHVHDKTQQHVSTFRVAVVPFSTMVQQ